MLEYVAYALLGLAIVGGLLYVTMSPEMEQSKEPRPRTTSPNHLRCKR